MTASQRIPSAVRLLHALKRTTLHFMGTGDLKHGMTAIILISCQLLRYGRDIKLARV